jgi:hypothetical protein
MQASAMLLSVVMLGFALGAGLIFTFAGLGHWRHRRLLSGVVANYRLLPDGMVNPVAAVLPWAELALGLGLLLSPVMPVLGRVQTWSGAQSCSFWLGHGGEPAARARHIDCGCGHAELRQPLNWLLVAQYLRWLCLCWLWRCRGGIARRHGADGGDGCGAGGLVGLSSFQCTGGAAIQPAFGHFASTRR